MKKILKILFVFLLVFTISCKKDSDTDKVTTQTIHWQVYNLCTDSGMTNIAVSLQENGNTIGQIISGTNGSFSFNNIQIHSSNSYTYQLYIPSESGIGGGGGIDAGYYTADKDKLNSPLILDVIPHSNQIILYYPANTHLSLNDTFILSVQQNIYHKNIPNGNFKVIAGNCPNYPPSTNFIGNIDNYWMGWWQVTLDKTKNGVHIIKTDSFYIGYKATVTDTIPW